MAAGTLSWYISYLMQCHFGLNLPWHQLAYHGCTPLSSQGERQSRIETLHLNLNSSPFGSICPQAPASWTFSERETVTQSHICTEEAQPVLTVMRQNLNLNHYPTTTTIIDAAMSVK